MFHLRSEGEPLKTGLNFYRWEDRVHSIGVIISIPSCFKIGFPGFLKMIRWSAKKHRVFVV